ncbi:MAG: AMP-binding protein [Candidatus Aenigmarchaeota archaeon]|nr:AMP-binding protein [Candidatus Aenigmarchaeota archaeon]
MNLAYYLFEYSKNLDKDIIIGDKECISYKDLWGKIVLISSYISEYRNEKIGLMADNSIFFVAAYFSIIKSGNTVVTFSPQSSEKGIMGIIMKTDMKLVFVQEKYEKSFIGIKKINEKEYLEIKVSEKSLSEFGETNPDDVAVLIFTSGSTGDQKGVMQTHENIIENTKSIIEYLEIKEKDIQLVVLPFSYCFGSSLLHTHIRQGASIVLNNTFALTNTVIDDLIKYKCTAFSGVPSHYQILLRKSKFKDTAFPDLRYMTQAGGNLPVHYIKEIRKSHPNTPFIVMYGQTEATARLSYLPFGFLGEKLGSIGKGIPGVELKVVNEKGESVKPGEPGEITARGKNIMKGYYKDEEGTSNVIKNGYLYTGDIATVDEDGFIFIKSREKHIIKSAGNRISPKEIENVLSEMDEIINSVVIGVEDDLLGEVPKAIVAVKNKKITVKDVDSYCRQRLATYKVPKYVEIVDSIPLTPSGKTDTSKIVELYGRK